jgi:hypothetical protein
MAAPDPKGPGPSPTDPVTITLDRQTYQALLAALTNLPPGGGGPK